MNHLLVAGNPADGFRFVGPFATAEEAGNWADLDRDTARDTWWVVTLEAPDEEDW